ncbi:MAG TPA: Dna2/Cas4 domain-containing protein [Steroidobacteraceae bacterium]|nr:Dna2/Cas4 domain-containing protein [Steroidobacteraceae bacterium]
MTALVIASIMLVLLGVLLRIAAKRQAGAFDLSDQILYADTGQSVVDLLVSDRYHLIGRPDYILDEHGEQVPVERKSRMLTHSGPHDSERLQLGAYCLLVEERQGRPVSRGRLQYQNTTLDIPFDDTLRGRVLAALAAIQSCADVANVRRSHPSPSRCHGCGYRTDCGESLAR